MGFPPADWRGTNMASTPLPEMAVGPTPIMRRLWMALTGCSSVGGAGGSAAAAGVGLVFDCKILKIRAALPEEVTHGHVHGAGGHHH